MSINERLRELFEEAESITPEQLEVERERSKQVFMLEPSVVTSCHTCGHIAYMPRLGCANRKCPDQPMAVNVSHYYENYQGQLLRPGVDWVPLEQRPLTEWT